MKLYLDINNDSGITALKYGDNWIHIQFSSGKIYEYTYPSAGSQIIEQMKVLAEAGDDLNAFINQHAKKSYLRIVR